MAMEAGRRARQTDTLAPARDPATTSDALGTAMTPAEPPIGAALLMRAAAAGTHASSGLSRRVSKGRASSSLRPTATLQKV